jgi:hypothetical protein
MFGDVGGFVFTRQKATEYEIRNFHTARSMDICYCNEGCDKGEGWFKVGEMRYAPFRLVSAATSQSDVLTQWSIEYIHQPGIVGFHRPLTDYGTLGLQEEGSLKLVQDPTLKMDDAGCSIAIYDNQLTSDLTFSSAPANYKAKPQKQDPPDLTKLVFNADTFQNTITIKKAGLIAVCYCAFVKDNVCQDNNWKMVTHLTIRGPVFYQSWIFSTNLYFRFEYLGHGLSSNDKIRIIAPDGHPTYRPVYA